MKKELELKMYGFTPYNISDTQKGIQFGHAVVRFSRELSKSKNPTINKYEDWADNYETFIILNGGTTNNKRGDDGLYKGTLNNHLQTLVEAGLDVGTFYEPDLGDQLSAICFLVDERVFDRIRYPDFVPEDWKGNEGYSIDDQFKDWLKQFDTTDTSEINKILFLRDFLPKFRLA